MRNWIGAIAGLALAAQAGGVSAQSLTTLAATPDRPFLIESVARDASGALIISSVHKGALFKVAADGTLSPYGPAGEQAMFVLVADPARQSLWVASSPSPNDDQTDRPGELLQLDLMTGAVKARYSAAGPDHAFGDVALGPDGAVFVGDSKTQQIMVLKPGSTVLEPLVKLTDRGSPQGMVVSPDGRWLVFADYRSGLHRIDISDGRYTLVTLTPETLAPLAGPEGIELRGIDGLVRDGDRIIAIQNGTATPRVLQLTLAPDWSAVTHGRALVEGAPLNDPTTGFLDGRDLIFVSRSQWPEFTREGRPSSETPPGAVVSRLTLP
ncbi:MAG: hypothetical protein EON89_06550 [Brevundimonas sp.]|nr:MAG: hypothetical protein EON89_06550 [Brevundimonas sp.]